MRPVQFTGVFNFFQTKSKDQKLNEASSPESTQPTLLPAYGEHTKDELTLSGREVPRAELDFNEWMAIQSRDFEREHPDKKGDEEEFSRFLERRQRPAPQASSGNSSALSSHRVLQVTGDRLYASDPYEVTRRHRQSYQYIVRQGYQESREERAERHREERRRIEAMFHNFERGREGRTVPMQAARNGNRVTVQQLYWEDRSRPVRTGEHRHMDLAREDRSGHYIPPSEYLERLLNEGVVFNPNNRSNHSNRRH